MSPPWTPRLPRDLLPPPRHRSRALSYQGSLPFAGHLHPALEKLLGSSLARRLAGLASALPLGRNDTARAFSTTVLLPHPYRFSQPLSPGQVVVEQPTHRGSGYGFASVLLRSLQSTTSPPAASRAYRPLRFAPLSTQRRSSPQGGYFHPTMSLRYVSKYPHLAPRGMSRQAASAHATVVKTRLPACRPER